MSDLLERLRRTKQVEQRCCNCGHTMKGYSGLRHAGFYTTHGHADCIRLLHADAEEAADTIEAQAAEIERLQKALRAILDADERGQGQPFADAMRRARAVLRQDEDSKFGPPVKALRKKLRQFRK